MMQQFWIALFLALNLLFQSIWFAVESFVPRLDLAPAIVTLVKLTYFLSVSCAVYGLVKLWPRWARESPNAATWGYRTVGLAAVGALIAVHAPAIYRYADAERDLIREIRATHRVAPVVVAPGVRLEQARIEKNEAIYEYTMTGLTAAQVDTAKVRDLIRATLEKAVCANGNLLRVLSHGARLHYVYRDRAGLPLADIALSQASCMRAPA
jgi:hypothetical protein